MPVRRTQSTMQPTFLTMEAPLAFRCRNQSFLDVLGCEYLHIAPFTNMPMLAKKKHDPFCQRDRSVRLVLIEDLHEQIKDLRRGADQLNGSHVRCITMGDTSRTSGLVGSRGFGHSQLKGLKDATFKHYQSSCTSRSD